MWQYKHTDELYHYGVQGMKWGHRKSIGSEQKSDGKSQASKNKSTAIKILAGIGIAAVATVAVGAAVKYGKPATQSVFEVIRSKPLKMLEHIPNTARQKAAISRWARNPGQKLSELNNTFKR